jgi:ABC-2 type transport system permease protein
MHRWHAFMQLFLSRFREFFREPEAIFWVYGFPVLLALGLGIAFPSREPDPAVIDIQGSREDSSVAALEALLKGSFLVEVHDEPTTRQRLRDGKTTLVLVPENGKYRCLHDPRRPESLSARYQVEAMLLREERPTSAQSFEAVTIEELGNRYIDFLLPGLMGMNLMGGGLWGVGFVVVDMRIRKLLKRLLATPMRRGDFLLAVMSARLVFLIPEMLSLLLIGWLVFGIPIRGSLFALAVVILVGSAAFSGLGLLVACRADKIETVSGLMNLVMLPMWLLSGTFFSAKRFPEVIQPVIQALPLTQLNDALREVMLEGASLFDVGWRLGLLMLWAVIPFALGLRWFKWK